MACLVVLVTGARARRCVDTTRMMIHWPGGEHCTGVHWGRCDDVTMTRWQACCMEIWLWHAPGIMSWISAQCQCQCHLSTFCIGQFWYRGMCIYCLGRWWIWNCKVNYTLLHTILYYTNGNAFPTNTILHTTYYIIIWSPDTTFPHPPSMAACSAIFGRN